MKINSRIKRKSFTTVTAVALAAAVIVGGGTWLNLRGSADGTSVMSVDLQETTGSVYSIVPGKTDSKNPTITLSNSTEAYVFVEVEDRVNSGGKVVGYEMADGWVNITDKISSDKRPEGIEIFYKKVDANANGQTIQVLKGNKVSYDKSLTNADLLNVTAGHDTLSFKAKAIEANIFSNEGNDDISHAKYAYEHFFDDVMYVTDTNDWNIVLSEVNKTTSETFTVYVNKDYTLNLYTTPSFIDLRDISTELTIKGNGTGASYDIVGSRKINNTYNYLNSMSFFNCGKSEITLEDLKIYDRYYLNTLYTNGTKLTLNNVTIEKIANNVSSTNYDGGARSAICAVGNSEIIIKGRTVITAENTQTIGGSYSKYALSIGNGSTVSFDQTMSGTVTGLINVENGGTLVIKSGTFISSGLTYSQIKSYASGHTVKVYNENSNTPVANPKSGTKYYKYVVS